MRGRNVIATYIFYRDMREYRGRDAIQSWTLVRANGETGRSDRALVIGPSRPNEIFNE